jgi:hypothetical protein
MGDSSTSRSGRASVGSDSESSVYFSVSAPPFE